MVNGYADDGIGNSRISIGVRGLNPRRSSRVLILEDGVPIQPALYVYPNMYYNPPSERIDRLEVIKGSGTIQYGPQTMGGVINYFTKRPRSEYGGKFKIRIEDTDQTRNKKESLDSILTGLDWLGLKHDSEVVYQSKNILEHKKIINQQERQQLRKKLN